MSGWIHRRRRSLARAVLALFCLVWLQAAAIPCAMAASPPASDMSGMEECPYCPLDPFDDGGVGNEACVYPDAPQVDARGTLAAATALPISPATIAFVGEVSEPRRIRLDDWPAAIPRPPATLSYCRFLK